MTKSFDMTLLRAGVTLQQMREIEDRMSVTGMFVTFQCGETRIEIHRIRVNPRRLVDVLWVASIDGIPNTEPNAISQTLKERIYRRSQSYRYTAESRKRLMALTEKQRKRRGYPDLDEKRIVYSPYWTNLQSMMRDLCRQNESVTLVPDRMTEVIHGRKGE